MGKVDTTKVLLYLLNCGVNRRIPEINLKDIDVEELKRISSFQSVTAMISYALDTGKYLSNEFMAEEQIKFWASTRIKSMQKSIMYEAERRNILESFEKNGVWYMPLKGCILKELYPDIGLREMADNDILFDRERRSWLHDEMERRGYFTKNYDKSNHDVYMKKPFYNFEFHVELMESEFGDIMGEYYKNVKDRLIKDECNACGYHFSDEDFYVYMIAHAIKHFKRAGTGIRILLDVYIYLQEKGQSMDWNYISNELARIGETSLEMKIREIALELFDPSKNIEEMYIEEEEKQTILEYMIGSGTYGTLKNKLQNDLEKIQENNGKIISVKTKFKFIIKRLFPGVKHMGRYAPFCKKHKWTIPFFWIYRIVRSMFKRRKHMVSEARELKKL